MSDWPYILFVYLAPAAALISLGVAVFSWRFRSASGAAYLSIQSLLVAGWLLTNTLELVTTTNEATLFFARLCYVFIATVPVFWFAFALSYSGRQKWLSFPGLVFFFILPVVTNILVWTNGFHTLIWQSYEFVPVGPYLAMRVASYGVFFWVFGCYFYLLLLLGSALIVIKYFRAFRLFRQQSFWLIFGTLTPLVFNIIYVFKLIPDFQKDYSAPAFALASLAFAVGIFRYRLFQVKQLPRETVVDYMCDGMIVLDEADRILDVNLAARNILGDVLGGAIGMPLVDYLPVWNELSRQRKSNELQVNDVTILTNGTLRHYELKVNEFSNPEHDVSGQLVILHDITERVHLLNQVQQLATVDPVVGLYNRRHFMVLAQKEYENAHRYKKVLSVILLDIDHFKQVNDTYGHSIGDQALLLIARHCQESLRVVDLPARYGGDEFIFLLPETGVEAASMAAERIRNGIQRIPVFTNNNGAIFITASLGVAGISPDEELPLEKLFERADDALYNSKQSGRNRVTIWQHSWLVQPNQPPLFN
jgi:diguanylate cyclase (GGDEF)-like protein/PAS domain S-box-containing protein